MLFGFELTRPFAIGSAVVCCAFYLYFGDFNQVLLQKAEQRDASEAGELLERQRGPKWLVITPLAVPQLGSCASPGRAWWLWAARPLGAQPPPQELERAASKFADSTACDLLGATLRPRRRGRRRRWGGARKGGGGSHRAGGWQVKSEADQPARVPLALYFDGPRVFSTKELFIYTI